MSKIIVDSTVKVRCEYTLIRVNSRTGREVQRIGPCRNLIPSAGLDRLLDPSTSGNFRVAVGAGTKVEEMSDTMLESWIATTGTANTDYRENEFQVVDSPIYYRKRMAARFGEGAAAGNVGEVAWLLGGGGATENGPVFSRARVRDANGDPTVITILPDEFLDVVIDYYIYPQEEASGTVSLMIDGVPTPHNYIVRPSGMSGNSWGNADPNTAQNFSGPKPIIGFGASNLNITRAWNGAIGSVTGNPSGTASGNLSGITYGSYTAGQHWREFTVPMGLAQANLTGGVRTMRIDLGQAAMQCEYDPPIDKISTKTLSLTYRVSVANAS